ncbi:MAG: alpha-2-macroglobulin [Planctomycetes bacterium]|nr:alpha-2-macroglobulin [Planctomycetota bacterium]
MRRSSPDPARLLTPARRLNLSSRVAMKLGLCLQAVLVCACLALPESLEPVHGTPQPASAQQEPIGDGPFARAEAAYREKSYAKAHELYESALKGELDATQRAWGEFRLADTRWRSAAQTNDPDAGELDAAAHDLSALLERFERPETRTDLYAELHESLGDGRWRAQSQDWGGAGAHYAAALDWWAHSSDLERARERYLAIVWKASLPEWREKYYGYNYFPTLLPLDVLANAVEIAESEGDRARAHFLLGRAWMNQGYDRRAQQRIEAELGAVLELGKRSEWYDDALYALANFGENQGRWERDANGNLAPRPDYVRALVLYRRLVEEFKKGETRYSDECQQRIRDLTAPSVSLQVERFFLPGSEAQYTLAWRNLERVELELVPIDLTRDVVFTGDGNDDWLNRLALTRKPSARWTHDTKDPGKHEPGAAQLLLESKPEAGAYVLHASGGGKEARALVLVSDAAVTVKGSGSKLLAWATDAKSGAPIAEADVHLWVRWHDGSWHILDQSEQTGADGVALFELAKTGNGGQYFVALKSGARQSFAQGWVPGRAAPAREWRIYATADRGAYRPGDEVQWKFWARTRFASAYQTPANEKVTWELRDPQGTAVQTGTSTLNAFGAAWGSFATSATMTLGEYHLQFYRDARKNEPIGETALFRLEEYKLPEYEVAVKTPRDADGKPKLFRLGDRVEVEIESTYYYGAPVAGAAVEVFVHQRPRYRPIPLHCGTREFPWFYDDQRAPDWWGGQGQQIFHDTRQSDPAGKVTIAFDSPAEAQGEFEFEVTARVVDASRREIVGTGSVVVAERGYRVDIEFAHAIHRPGAKVELVLRATDPNGNPVADEGEVVVTRERWLEIWRDASGRELFGDALQRAQAEPGFPLAGWNLKQSGYESEVLQKTTLRTGADGIAKFEFTPAKEGTYVVRWSSTDDRDADIRAEARLFVADERTTQLGYLPGGIEILVDQDTLAVGQDALVMLAAPQSGRWVLFTVEGEELYQHQVLQLSGQVKLVRVPITEAYVPNVFLGALSMWSGQAYQDVEELIVPPTKQFLSLELSSDKSEYEPGSEGSVSVLVKDHSGEPVVATLSLAIVDEAVSYIQGDYAIDPRRFFYGDKRPQLVQTGGSFQHGTYSDLERDDKGGAKERRLSFRASDDERKDMDALGYSGGRGGMLAKMSAVNAPEAAERFKADGATRQELSGNVVPEERAAGGVAAPVVRVRSDFRATALWLPDVTTDKNGRATARLKFPDSPTRWKATARACDVATRVGEGSTTVKTRLPLVARLQSPRFLVVGDEATLSGNLNNNTAAPLTVDAALTVEGLELLGCLIDGKLVKGNPPALTIPANGQVRVDWRVSARANGTAKLKLAALGQEYGDALERELPVYEHGIEAYIDLAGKLDEGALALTLLLPKERRPGSTQLEVTLAPSLAVTMLDALPYLVDYPYGCVEQTLSRFLPAVIVAKTLKDSGLSVEDAMTRVFGGVELDSAQKTHPKGKQALAQLDAMTKAGLERLYDFQHSDGGWAWWKDGDSNHFMTAYVLWGLALARDAGIEVQSGVLENAARFLAAELVEAEREPDLQAWMLHALSAFGGAGTTSDAKKFQATAFANLWERRDALNAYGRALLCLAAHAMGRAEDARVLAENLRNGALIDRSPDTSIVQVGTHQPYTIPTAHWGQDGVFYRWSEGGVEATAFALRALVAVNPKDELVTPVMNWLVKNRRGAQWSNTRDTAITVLALDEYLRQSRELGSAVEYELAVNGTRVATQRLEQAQLLSAPGTFVVDPALLRDGANEIRVTKKSGAGPLYFAARAHFFSLEEPLVARGNELFVRRDLYRLAARKTLLAGTVYERVPLLDGESVTSGERVEVVLTIEAKNELEYLVFEDLKPAGLEAVQVKSGEPIAAQELEKSEGQKRFAAPGAGARRSGTGRDVALETRVGEGYTGRARSAHQELRDRKVAFFLEKLPQGLWELRYELRAETPGRYHALPTLGHAMYVPEIHANGEELRMSVVE